MDPSVVRVCQRTSTRQVLATLWDRGVVRADDVISRLGLTRSTTLQSLDALIDLGLVEEAQAPRPDGARTTGRPARRFRLRPSGGAIAGVEAGQRSVVVTVTDLSGTPLASRSADIPDPDPPHLQDPRTRRALTRRTVTEALAQAGLAPGDVVALGVGVPAPVDAHGRSPQGADGFWRTMHAGLLEELRGEFPHVRMENDASLAALAELHLGAAQQERSFVAVLAAWGIGSGVVIDGHLVHGAHGGVGELGFLPPFHGTGGSAGLHEVVERWIRDHWQPHDLPAGHPWRDYLEGGQALRTPLTTVRPDDPVTRPLFDSMSARLTRILRLLAAAYDPSCIIVCGPAAAGIEPVLDHVQQALDQEAQASSGLPAPRLAASPLGADVVSLGATAAARELARDVVVDWALARRLDGQDQDAAREHAVGG